MIPYWYKSLISCALISKCLALLEFCYVFTRLIALALSTIRHTGDRSLLHSTNCDKMPLTLTNSCAPADTA